MTTTAEPSALDGPRPGAYGPETLTPQEALRLLYLTYRTLKARGRNTRFARVQFVAANRGEGTSTVARDFAMIAAQRAHERVLLMDLSLPLNAQLAWASEHGRLLGPADIPPVEFGLPVDHRDGQENLSTWLRFHRLRNSSLFLSERYDIDQPRSEGGAPRGMGEFWDTLIRSGRWRIVEASPLDCRIQFENESADQFPVGALISMRREGAADWQIGVVRRVKRFEGNRIELGVEMIAREVKAIRLWPDNIRDQYPPNGAQAPDSAALVALYLPSTGAIPPAPSRTLILRHSDYKAGLSVFHISGDSRISLQLGAAIEIGRGWVWSPFAVEGRSARAGDSVAEATTQGMTTRLPVGSGATGRNR